MASAIVDASLVRSSKATMFSRKQSRYSALKSVAEDESIATNQVIERVDLTDKVEDNEVVEEDSSEEWYSEEE